MKGLLIHEQGRDTVAARPSTDEKILSSFSPVVTRRLKHESHALWWWRLFKKAHSLIDRTDRPLTHKPGAVGSADRPHANEHPQLMKKVWLTIRALDKMRVR